MVYMSKKKEKIDLNNLAPEEELKYEIAKELGTAVWREATITTR